VIATRARPRAPRAGLVAGLALALLGALPAAQGLGAPALPTAPADDAVVDTLRPTFSWSEATTPGLTTYQVVVETPGGQVVVAEVPHPVTTAVATQDLPDETRLRWLIRSIGIGREITPVASRTHVRVASRPAPPALEGPSGLIGTSAPSFSWTGSRTDSVWRVHDGAGAAVQAGASPTPSGQATLSPLPDGSYVFQVAQRAIFQNEGDPATRAFTVDTTPPAPLTVRASVPSPTRGVTPSFTWSGVEPGAVATWRVTGSGGGTVVGPANALGSGASPPPLPAGAYVFEARQTDAAGNVGAWGTEPFAILPGPAAAPATTRARLPRRNVKNLIPRLGAKIRATRPTLRWKGARKGTRLFNVQVFRVADGNRLVKVISTFPRTTHYAIPRRARLTRGACYVWRVWPYQGTRFTRQPLGVSNFCVRPRGR
jgi:hypothetical protein